MSRSISILDEAELALTNEQRRERYYNKLGKKTVKCHWCTKILVVPIDADLIHPVCSPECAYEVRRHYDDV